LQNLDRSRTAQQQAGFDFFNGPNVDSGVENCEGCHNLPLGTNGRINFEGDDVSQDFKVPHLRNAYDKVGRFNEEGAQVTGFGYLHDGSEDTLVDFLRAAVFDFPGATEADRDAIREDLAAFVLAFDTGMAPLVGRQLTLDGPPGAEDGTLLDLLQARSAAGDCDLVARAPRDGVVRAWLLTSGAFRPDRAGEAPVDPDGLIDSAAPGAELTFVCVPPGDGYRSALDRDGDGHLDGDERDAGSDPADPDSRPGHLPPPTTPPPATSPTPTADPPSPTPTASPGAHRVYLPFGQSLRDEIGAGEGTESRSGTSYTPDGPCNLPPCRTYGTSTNPPRSLSPQDGSRKELDHA
jgi:hypothetical protein